MRIRMDFDEYEMFSTWWKGAGRDIVVNQIGQMTKDNVESAFRKQGRDGEWPPRGAPNVAGIIRRVNRGEDPKDTDFIEMPALLDSGKLKNSFELLVGKSGVVVFSPLLYGERMQKGIIDRLRLEPIGRRHLADWLKRLPEDTRRLYRSDIGWLLNKKRKRKRVRIKPHKRVMLKVDQRDQADIKAYIGKMISGFKSGPTKKVLAWRTTTNTSAIYNAKRIINLGTTPGGKRQMKILALVKPKAAPGSFSSQDNYKAAYFKPRFPKANL
jgi:hypothetical protein